MPASRLVSLWLPVLGWAALIFGLSSIPSLTTELGVWDTVLRKLAHLTEYAVLGALLARATGSIPVAAAAGVAYAVSDEAHQRFVPGRDGSAGDVVIDAFGVALGIAAYLRLARSDRVGGARGAA